MTAPSSPRTPCWPGARRPPCPGNSSPRQAHAERHLRGVQLEDAGRALETLFFGLDQARRIVASWVADYNAARPHSALGYETPAAFAAQFAATGDRLHAMETFRRSPMAPSAQAGKCHPAALVSGG
ncbi:transposase [Paracoccus sp. S-4012]|nr:transposase [Paracoccus sp. S-4012]